MKISTINFPQNNFSLRISVLTLGIKDMVLFRRIVRGIRRSCQSATAQYGPETVLHTIIDLSVSNHS